MLANIFLYILIFPYNLTNIGMTEVPYGRLHIFITFKITNYLCLCLLYNLYLIFNHIEYVL